MTFLLCDPGWCVHKSDVQNKWDDNTMYNTHPPTHTHTHSINSSIINRSVCTAGANLGDISLLRLHENFIPLTVVPTDREGQRAHAALSSFTDKTGRFNVLTFYNSCSVQKSDRKALGPLIEEMPACHNLHRNTSMQYAIINLSGVNRGQLSTSPGNRSPHKGRRAA